MIIHTLQTVGNQLQELLAENTRLRAQVVELLVALDRRPAEIETDCPNCGKTLFVEEE